MIGVALAMLVSGPVATAGGDDPVPRRPQALTTLLACHAIRDEGLRLACYDREVAAFEAAERDRKVIVLDQEQVRSTRRSLFGFSLPSLNLFGKRPDKAADRGVATSDDIATLDASVKTIERLGDGQVAFTLDNGARWAQTDGRTISLARIRPGTNVRITRGALGSYFAAFAGSVSIKVRRIG
jgi:hypothetical protein